MEHIYNICRHMRRKIKTIHLLIFLSVVIAIWFVFIRLPPCDDASTVASVSSSQVPKPKIVALKSWQIPDWVNRYNISHLFNWIWHQNEVFQMCRTSIPPVTYSYACRAKSPIVVNDIIDYFRSHSNEGCIVDNIDCLPKLTPQPLPRARSLADTCSALKIDKAWIFCKMLKQKRNDWLSAKRRIVTFAVYNAFIDPASCHESVPGTIFTERATFYLQPWVGINCINKPFSRIPKIKDEYRHSELINSIGNYLKAPGHFGPEQLPRLLRLLATVPTTAKVLVAKGGIADAFMDILVERGIVTRDRIIPFDNNIRPNYFANIVYRSDSWPYISGEDGSYYAHDRTDIQLVHQVMTGNELSPNDKRDRIILIKRDKGGDRSIIEHLDLLAFMSSALNKSKLASKLHIEVFDARGHLRDHINLFRRARVIVGPHGAGMMNVMWASPGTHVVEIGYTTGMTLPEMYAIISLHLKHSYWVCKGHGSYFAPIHVDMNDFIYIFNTIIQELEAENR